jgi:hypothetical protein
MFVILSSNKNGRLDHRDQFSHQLHLIDNRVITPTNGIAIPLWINPNRIIMKAAIVINDFICVHND